MSRKAPPGYIAGLGRGAVGFTTRSDLGPIQGNPLQSAQAAVAQAKAEWDRKARQSGDRPAGAGGAQAAASRPYEADEEEADRIYRQVEARLTERRKRRRDAVAGSSSSSSNSGGGGGGGDRVATIADQFKDLRPTLASVTEEQWATLPEVTDLVTKRGSKKSRLQERFTSAPDTLLLAQSASLGSLAAPANAVAPGPRSTGSGSGSGDGDSGSMTDLVSFSQGRDRMLAHKLDHADSGTATSVPSVDAQGYMTSLHQAPASGLAVGDVQRARLLLTSAVKRNPTHAAGWIAAARLEQQTGQTAQARTLLAQGCAACPKSESLWLEAIAMHPPAEAAAIAARAVRELPSSVALWTRAAQLASSPAGQRRVLRRALALVPSSLAMWKMLIALEDRDEDARVLMAQAVACVPLALELWLALARLEPYEQAKQRLNQARQHLPTAPEIWIAAAQLEEANDHAAMVPLIVRKAAVSLTAKQAGLAAADWLAQAYRAEDAGFGLTAEALADAEADADADAEALADACRAAAADAVATNPPHPATARAAIRYGLARHPAHTGLWTALVELEQQHGTADSVAQRLHEATAACPTADVLWLMAAKHHWRHDAVGAAQRLLDQALGVLPDSEAIWVAAVRLAVAQGALDRALDLVVRARARDGLAARPRLAMKHAVLLRQLGREDDAAALLTTALAAHPTAAKLYLILAQIHDGRGETDAARAVLSRGCKAVPAAAPLWLQASALETRAGHVARARALLERALLVCPTAPALWIAAVRLEQARSATSGRALLAKALTTCPPATAGPLWAFAILQEPRAQRRARAMDALKQSPNDAHVLLVVARLFAAERKIDRARTWFRHAVTSDSDLGDAWAYWYRFEMEHGTAAARARLIGQCRDADPRHGELWQAVSKALPHLGKPTEAILPLAAA
ncbi:hypothetical protein CXG81DRAFT_4888, partial [Caulochytrium protostelioides]